MEIIPVINCTDLDAVKIKIARLKEVMAKLGGDESYWIHVDVADGSFTNGYQTWRHAADLKELSLDSRMKIEVHIMSTEAEFLVREWLEAGAKRVIIHLEPAVSVDGVAQLCEENGAEFWLATTPDTPADKLFPYVGLIKGCQVLAVRPGLPAQKLDPGTYDKIAAIRHAYEHLPIEVDGGVDETTAPLLAKAGATQLAAGTALFESKDPAAAYCTLKGVVY